MAGGVKASTGATIRLWRFQLRGKVHFFGMAAGVRGKAGATGVGMDLAILAGFGFDLDWAWLPHEELGKRAEW
jgi:hypothetical protein